MLAFPFTLKGKAKQWIRRLPARLISTWDLFKNLFLEEYRPPSKIIKQIEAIRSFKQKPGEPLYCSWERFTESLFNCPEHKLNEQEQLHFFYQGSDVETRRNTKNSAGRGVDELKVVFEQINDFEHSMKFVTEEVRMVQHRFDTPIELRVTNVEKILNKFIKESFKKQKYSVNLIWGIKNNFDQVFKAQASSIKKLEVQLGKIAETVQNREIGSLPSFTEINLKGLAHFITTRSGLNYKPPPNPLVNSKDSNDT
ncbi:leucine-rich repeat receptor-like protein kinase PXL2 [Tanacetum coccineum]|uniref:Leucine-rich repeat receptor-like protein kinase PXL2 n=1 Tax=Tanacetum coccineum TaxID=301880 RepID=A0ABQ5HD22_9ASTR